VIGLNIAVHAPNEILVQGRGLDAELGGDLQVGGTVDAPTRSAADSICSAVASRSRR
jgi:autotransporter translocation and assembly factor TamB